MLRCFFQATVFAFITLVTGVAFAQDPVDEAFKAFEAGDFVGAASHFKAAYEATGDGVLKLNEMVAWWRADRCEEAMAAHAAALEAIPQDQRQPQDLRDLNKVEADCQYQSARTLFEQDDLDGAEAALEDLSVDDPEVNQAIGALRIEIKNRRAELAEAAEANKEPAVAPISPVEPAPKWMLWTGIGLTSAGAGLGVVTLIKWAVERGQLESGYNVIAQDYNCVYSLETNGFSGEMCDEPAMRADNRYATFDDELKNATTQNLALGITGGVVGSAGIGVLVYYFIRDAKHAKYEESKVTLLPDIRPGYGGAVFHLTF